MSDTSPFSWLLIEVGDAVSTSRPWISRIQSSAVNHDVKQAIKRSRVLKFRNRLGTSEVSLTAVGLILSRDILRHKSRRWVCFVALVRGVLEELSWGFVNYRADFVAMSGDTQEAVSSCCSALAAPPQNTGMLMNRASPGVTLRDTHFTWSEHAVGKLGRLKQLRVLTVRRALTDTSGTECAFSADLWTVRSRSNLFERWERLWIINHTCTVCDMYSTCRLEGRFGNWSSRLSRLWFPSSGWLDEVCWRRLKWKTHKNNHQT